MLAYLRYIDNALHTNAPLPLNPRHPLANRFLTKFLGMPAPAPDARPCRLPACASIALKGSEFCSTEHEQSFAQLLTRPIRVKMTSLWSMPADLQAEFGRGAKDPGYRWDNVQLVAEDPYDYLVVINKPHASEAFQPERTIVFHMEPHMEKEGTMWGDWCDPVGKLGCLRAFRYSSDLNNLQWHLNRTYTELMNETITKTEDKVSAILSAKYHDYGQVLRWDFAKYLCDKGDVPLELWGTNRFNLPNHRGNLPPLDKTMGLYPYKYHLAGENNAINNYISEKLVDGILSECLVFYWGAPNARDLIDPRAYVQLELSNFERDYDTIKRAIREDWWSQRIQYIRAAKQRILNELAFMPRVAAYLNSLIRN